MTACCIVFSDLLCAFGSVCPPHSGHESCFVVFLVAFCKRQGLYQSVVTQSISCLGAGLVLTMLMAGLLLNWEALWSYLLKVEWTLFSPFFSPMSICPGAPRACLTLMTHNFLLLRHGISLRIWKTFDGIKHWRKCRKKHGKRYSWHLGFVGSCTVNDKFCYLYA